MRFGLDPKLAPAQVDPHPNGPQCGQLILLGRGGGNIMAGIQMLLPVHLEGGGFYPGQCDVQVVLFDASCRNSVSRVTYICRYPAQEYSLEQPS